MSNSPRGERKRLNSTGSQNSENKRRRTGKECVDLSAIRDRLKLERHHLPICRARKRLLLKFSELRGGTSIVIGETGSGKTTQIPQYIYEAGLYKGGIIGCTQPRRVAAITVAQRVASEMGTSLGQLVGYNVRFDDMTSTSSKVIYMTDGMLLREALLDPLLARYTVIILDEAHERTIHTDVLFGVVKAAQHRRLKASNLKIAPLQVIVMSATMDVDNFSKYFNNAPVFYIEGRQHKVELFYARQPQPDYIFSSLVSVFQINQSAPSNEGILVFLTGQEEIESVVKSMRDISQDLPSDCPSLCVCPLYAALPPSQQLKVFGPSPKGSRKVIIATNIAETSVTIHGIKYVIDCGRVKAKSFKASSGLDMLAIQWVSKAQAWQRTGRAGREAPGTCYRLYTEDEFENLSENTTPEILRCNLASVVLQLLTIGVRDVAHFDFMDIPSPESVKLALQHLHWLGAIESAENSRLTDLGHQLAAFPLDPRLAKILVSASSFQCLCIYAEVSITNDRLNACLVNVEAMWKASQLRLNSSKTHGMWLGSSQQFAKREEALTVRMKFLDKESDHLTMLNIYKAYESCKGNKNWCHDNFINSRNMKQVSDIRNQLREICINLGLPFTSESDGANIDISTAVRKCLCSGYFMNAAERVGDGDYIMMANRKRVVIHPSSSLFHLRPSCVIYNELVQTTKCYMRDLSLVDPEWLYDATPASFRSQWRTGALLPARSQSK